MIVRVLFSGRLNTNIDRRFSLSTSTQGDKQLGRLPVALSVSAADSLWSASPDDWALSPSMTHRFCSWQRWFCFLRASLVFLPVFWISQWSRHQSGMYSALRLNQQQQSIQQRVYKKVQRQLKAFGFLYTFEESTDCAPLSSFVVIIHLFKLAHISVQGSTFHNSGMQGIYRQICNRESISRTVTYPHFSPYSILSPYIWMRINDA